MSGLNGRCRTDGIRDIFIERVYVFLLLSTYVYSYCSSMYSYCCLCTCILIVRPCILIVVYAFLLLSMYSYCSSIYSYPCLCILIVVYFFLLFVRVFLLLSMYVYSYCSSKYSYCCLCVLIVVYVFLLFVHVFLSLSMYTYCCLCILRHGYHDWGFSVLFPRLWGKCQGITHQDGARPALFQNCCVALCIVCFVSFYVLFVCKCVLLPPGDNPIAVNKYIKAKSRAISLHPLWAFVVCCIANLTFIWWIVQ